VRRQRSTPYEWNDILTLHRLLINFLSIKPDDFVFGDFDGVVVIPKTLVEI
jgi:hypothetical protein